MVDNVFPTDFDPKVTLVSGDKMIIADSADSEIIKQINVDAMKTYTKV